MTVRTFTRDFLKEELGLPGNEINNEIVSTSRWSVIHKIVFEFNGKLYQTYYSRGATESQYESPWENETEVDCEEVKLATVKVEQYVPIDHEEEVEPTPASNGLSFLAPPPAGFDSVALWAFYNQAEKEAKKGKEDAAKAALSEVKKTQHKFIKTQFGGAQYIEKDNRKAKDSLKFILQQAGKYDLCRKDDIDLKKVDELVEAGMLDKGEVEKHITNAKSTYLQIKK